MLTTIREHLEGRVTKADGIRLASSLVLALLLWGWVTTSQDPELARRFTNVEITTEELPGELQVISSLPVATVTLTGPTSVIEEISSSQVMAHLDLDDVTEPGAYRVPVIVSAPDGVWEHEVSPDRVSIEVEQTVGRQFALGYEQQGEPDAAVRITGVDMEVSEVTVRGPTSYVERVADVVLPVDLGDRTGDFTAIFEPIALDADGELIPEVDVSPNAIEASVRITSRGKNVAVIAQLIGEPAQGYEIVDRQIIPTTILIDGPDEALDELVAIQTEPVDINGVTATTSRSARLVGIPEGVRVIEPADGMVDVVVQVRQRGIRQQLPGQQVTVTNLASGLTADVTPDRVAISVVASEETLAQLPGADIEVQVDAAGLGPGTYSLQPKVALPPNAQWLSVEPDTVTVTITEAPASTPVASPPSAATPRGSPVPAR